MGPACPARGCRDCHTTPAGDKPPALQSQFDLEVGGHRNTGVFASPYNGIYLRFVRHIPVMAESANELRIDVADIETWLLMQARLRWGKDRVAALERFRAMLATNLAAVANADLGAADEPDFVRADVTP